MFLCFIFPLQKIILRHKQATILPYFTMVGLEYGSSCALSSSCVVPLIYTLPPDVAFSKRRDAHYIRRRVLLHYINAMECNEKKFINECTTKTKRKTIKRPMLLL